MVQVSDEVAALIEGVESHPVGHLNLLVAETESVLSAWLNLQSLQYKGHFPCHCAERRDDFGRFISHDTTCPRFAEQRTRDLLAKIRKHTQRRDPRA